jgi:DNA polymerase I-like protein with 3'-5' exonuclease and polymerase domains
MSTLVWDIETNGLLLDVSEIFCIHAIDIDSLPIHFSGCTPLEIKKMLEALSKATLLIGHNICGYDLGAIQKLYPNWTCSARLIDTMLLGCILYPEKGVMSLEDWAKELKLDVQKVAHDDWTKYSPEMGLRCKTDVEITLELYEYLSKHPLFDQVNARALQLEQSVAMIHAQQVINGVQFDIEKGIQLLHMFDREIQDKRQKIIELAPKKLMIHGVPQSKQMATKEAYSNNEDHCAPFCRPRKADGSYNEATKKYFGADYGKVRGPYTKIDIKTLNPDSDIEIKELLLSLGWVPTEWNKTYDKITKEFKVTSPKLTEDSYASLPEGLGKLIAEYNTLTHRRSFLKSKGDPPAGALASVLKRGDGRVTADAFTCGTPTSRYRHSGTVCNIPRPSSAYGKEIRSLFTVAPGCKLVGVDLSSIEARCLAHYLLKGKYKDAQKTADLILTGDFHSVNAKLWGVSRDLAKNGLYALLYGAGAKKLATTLGKPESMGARLKKDFYKEHPGILQLINDLERAFDSRGYLIGFDQRPLQVRGKNKLLNTLLQHTAAIIFKEWMVRLDEKRRMVRLDEKRRIGNGFAVFTPNVKQVIAYHDELQYEVFGDVTASLWGKECERQAVAIGKELNMLVPIEAKSSIGNDWGQTH